VFPVRELEGDGAAAGAGGEGTSTASGLERYGSVRSLSEEEKDEVDLHLKLVLEKSVARVKELIKAEEGEAQLLPTTASLRM
jgi:hypothetical protein